MSDITIDGQQLEKIVIDALMKKAKDELEGYKSPLTEIVVDAFKVNSDPIRSQIYAAVENTVKSKAFGESLQSALSHKLANLVINKCSGLVEKSFNDVMQDAKLRNKLQSAVIDIVEGGENDKQN